MYERRCVQGDSVYNEERCEKVCCVQTLGQLQLDLHCRDQRDGLTKYKVLTLLGTLMASTS